MKILNLTGGIQVQGRIYHTTNPARRYGLSAPLANGIDSSVLRLENHDADVLQVLTTASAPSVLNCFPRGNVSEEMRRPVGQTGMRVDEGRDGGSREGRIIQYAQTIHLPCAQPEVTSFHQILAEVTSFLRNPSK
jgi:hypothetical protein